MLEQCTNASTAAQARVK